MRFGTTAVLVWLFSVGQSVAAGEARASTPDRDNGGTEATADAQTADHERIGDRSKDELHAIVVTAQKREQREQDIPISLSVLTGSQLDQSPTQGVLSEALNGIPGVATFPSYEGGGTQVIIRGVTAADVLYSGPSPVAYYFDSAPFALIRGAIAPDASAFDLERVEVLRGPQGTLYGASSLNGVVRILTKDAELSSFDLKARTFVSTTDSGGGNLGADVAINVPIITDKLAVRAVFGDQDLSGWVDSPNKTDVNNANIHNYRLKIAAQPVDELSIGLFGERSLSNSGAPPTSSDHGKISALGAQPYSIDYASYGAKIDYESPRVSAVSNTAVFDFFNEGILDLYPYENSEQSGPPIPFLSHNSTRVVSEEILLNSKNTDSWLWSVGAFYRNAKEHDFQGLGDDASAADFSPVYGERLSSRSYAVFGQIGQQLFDRKLEWTVGLRNFHDDVKTQGDPGVPSQNPGLVGSTFNSTTPRAALTWRPTSDLTGYVSYSEGFRSGWPQQPGVSAVAPDFPSVKPDTLRNYEVGFKGDFLDHRLAVDSAVYYMDWREIQTGVGIVVNGLCCDTAGINANSASGIGTDLSVTVRPLDGLQLNAYFSWNNLEFDSDLHSAGIVLYAKGDRPPLSPEYTAGGSVDYLIRLGASGYTAQLTGSASYISRLPESALLGPPYSVARVISDTYQVDRLSITLNSPSHWSATVFADNLNNWSGSQRRINAYFGIPDWDPRIRPRTIGLQLNYSYK